MSTETLTTKTVHLTRGTLPTGPRPRAVISTDDVDAEKDRVIQAGLTFRENLRVTLSHDYRALPVGRVTMIHRRGHATEAEWEWFGNDEAAARAKNIYEQGGLDASIGFHVQEATANEFGGRDFTRARVVEFALTAVPANERAVALMKSHGQEPVLMLAADDGDELVEVDERVLAGAWSAAIAQRARHEVTRQVRGLWGTPDPDDKAVVLLDDGEPDELLVVDEREVTQAMAEVIAQCVGRELRQQLNALRGRID
jgi:hypothetical protein